MNTERKLKGLMLANRPGSVTRLNNGVFLVKSENQLSVYRVTRNGGGDWQCECTDFKFRRLPCKHIFAARFYLSANRVPSTFFDRPPKQQTLEVPSPGNSGEPAARPTASHTFGDRVTRGKEIAQLGNIIRRKDGVFLVPSQTKPNTYRRVWMVKQAWFCSCPDFQNRNVDRCKHIVAVTMSLMDMYLTENKEPPSALEKRVVCPKCGSSDIEPNGHTKKTNAHFSGKALYHCRSCKMIDDHDTYFSEPSLWRKERQNPEVAAEVIDWYCGGASLRVIQVRLEHHWGITVSHQTIWRWLQKWAKMMEDFVTAQKPTLSGVWHIDEMAVRVRDEDPKRNFRGRLEWLWNAVDRDTKFLVASELTVTKNEVDVMHVLRKAMLTAKEQPEVIVSDMYAPYPGGIERTFLPSRMPPQHIRVKGGAGTGKRGQVENQQAERINNELRERIKVQRGWKNDKTPLRPIQMIYHNYVRPHRSLGGKTPAEKALVPLNLGRNKFLGLVLHTLGFLRFVARLPPMEFPCLFDTSGWL